jgi:alkyl hydroperoxide reductase subunit AhpF
MLRIAYQIVHEGALMTDRLLNDNISKQVREVFENQLRHPVRVLYFGQQQDCESCADAIQLVEEVVALSDQLDLQVYDLEKDADLARHYGVDKAPSLVIAAKEGNQVTDHGIRMAGVPSGYEFSSFIQGLILVSGRDSMLKDKTRKALKELREPVSLLVFSTPT